MKYATRMGVGVECVVSLKNADEKREFNKSSAAHGGCLSSTPTKIREALCVIEFALALSR